MRPRIGWVSNFERDARRPRRRCVPELGGCPISWVSSFERGGRRPRRPGVPELGGCPIPRTGWVSNSSHSAQKETRRCVGVQRRVRSSLDGGGQSRATTSEILRRRSSRSGATTTTASEASEAQEGDRTRRGHGDHDAVARLPCDTTLVLALETG